MQTYNLSRKYSKYNLRFEIFLLFSFPISCSRTPAVFVLSVLKFISSKVVVIAGHLGRSPSETSGCVREVEFPELIKNSYKRLEFWGIWQKPAHKQLTTNTQSQHSPPSERKYLLSRWTACFAFSQLHFWWQHLRVSPWLNLMSLVRHKLFLLFYFYSSLLASNLFWPYFWIKNTNLKHFT